MSSEADLVPEEEKPIIPPVPESPTPVDNDQISLRVASSDGQEVYFKIRRTTVLRKLINAYCQRKGQPSQAIRFLFDGQRIQDDATPESLGMENEDVIDALLQQTGGQYSLFLHGCHREFDFQVVCIFTVICLSFDVDENTTGFCFGEVKTKSREQVSLDITYVIIIFVLVPNTTFGANRN